MEKTLCLGKTCSNGSRVSCCGGNTLLIQHSNNSEHTDYGGNAAPARSQIFFAALMSSTPKCWNVGSPFGTRGFNLIDNYMLRCGDQV